MLWLEGLWWLGGFSFTQTPRGTRDLTPPYSDAFRYVESMLLSLFSSWGYREVKTPLFEYLDVLSRGVGKSLVQAMFKAQDDDGNLIAFRAEMTTPVARLVCSSMLSEAMPLRLCYVSNVVRFKERFSGYPREFWQAGVELVGHGGVDADAEVIALMTIALKELGLRDVKIDIGHAGIFKRLLALANLKNDNVEKVKSLVLMKDSSGLISMLKSFNCDSNIVKAFEALCRVRGLKVLDEILDLLGDEVLIKHANELKTLFKLLEHHEIQSHIALDLSLIRGLNYYTGVIFEPYTSSFGRALGGGGRYDDLIASFIDKRIPATGFALIVDYLVEAIGIDAIAQRLERKRRVIIVPASLESYGEALSKAHELRAQGVVVEIHPIGDVQGAKAKAERLQSDVIVVR